MFICLFVCLLPKLLPGNTPQYLNQIKIDLDKTFKDNKIVQLYSMKYILVSYNLQVIIKLFQAKIGQELQRVTPEIF